MAVALSPRGGCPGHVSSMLPACILCQFLGTTKELLVMCMTEGLCISDGVQGSPQWGTAGLWGRGKSSALPQRLTSVKCPQCHLRANPVSEHPMPFCHFQEDRRADPRAGFQQPAGRNAVSREA